GRGSRAAWLGGGVPVSQSASGGRGSFVAFTRSAFVVKKANNAQPNWLRVGLAFGTSAALWALADDMVTKRRALQSQVFVVVVL
ncbi:hypothetical protein EK904_003076, partial [Melospiza melodia maxima]